MKKILLSLLIFQSFTLVAQNVVSNGDFENWINASALENWTTNNDVSQNTIDTAEGLSSALLNINNNVLEPELVTSVPLIAGTEYRITYQYKYLDINFNQNHPILLKVVRNGSATTHSSRTIATNNLWTEAIETFTPDQTGNYNLSLSLVTEDNNSFRVLLDDVKVQELATLSINDNWLDTLSIYPTITSDFTTINSIKAIKNLKISIFNTNGSPLESRIINTNTLNFSDFSSGLYFVKIQTPAGSIIKKIIKK